MIRFALVLCAAWLLGGCAGAPVVAPPPERQHLAALAALRNWTLDARFAARRGSEGWGGTVQWERRSDDFRIEVRSPVGQRESLLTVVQGRAVLESKDGRALMSDDAEALFAEQLGFRMPIRALRYWVLGLAAPTNDAAADAVRPVTSGRFESDGWVIHYTAWRSVGRYVLPERMVVEGHDLILRLVIDRWELPADG